MKGILLMAALLVAGISLFSQQDATVREYYKTFKTYPFSDPDPVPEVGKVYPYFRFDGYTNQAVNKEWKVVELENDFIKVMILPEIGGKIWAAIEKSTGKSFVYYNHVVKFRDVAMRGPWTSGGIEANYGIVGHTPNCATPVDYVSMKKPDGSVSCVIGVLDLLTRTTWRIDVNLPKDKAYFTTSSTWYNASTFEQPYYTWMNTGIKSAGNLQFIYPGTKYIGHAGEYSDWPIDKQGRDLSYYENNNFGEYKSYHVFGKYTDFFGGYYHDEDFGMARYSARDDKPGKKIWIWGLSDQGMIWEDLLTDDDGQYVEVQSGRLFNQPAERSSFTPFKNRGFIPNTTDQWTEYWFPVKQTKGFVAANNYGSLNVKKSGGRLVVYFCPVQPINDSLVVKEGDKIVYAKKLNLQTLQVFADSIAYSGNYENLEVELGNNKLNYDAAPDAGRMSRPVQTPKDFDWNSLQGLHLQGRELIRQRMYTPAEVKLRAALKADHNYLPALADLSLLLYRQMKYEEALEIAKRALSVDTYDPQSNYYYGLINEELGRTIDAKDGFEIATQSAEYRSAANIRLANIYFKEKDFSGAAHYAWRSIEANKASLDAYALLAVILRYENKKEEALHMLDTLISIDPLNHFAYFERYLWDGTDERKNAFTGLIQNEMPAQTYLELAAWYFNAGLNSEAVKVLGMVGSRGETDGPPPSPSAPPPPAGDSKVSRTARVSRVSGQLGGSNISPAGGGRPGSGNISPAGGGRPGGSNNSPAGGGRPGGSYNSPAGGGRPGGSNISPAGGGGAERRGWTSTPAEIVYWKSFLTNTPLDTSLLQPGQQFPFRNETAGILEKLIPANNHWLLKYHLALIRWNANDSAAAKKLFKACGNPAYAPFYAAKAKLFTDDSLISFTSLRKAKSLDPGQWRYSRGLINYYLSHGKVPEALEEATAANKKYPDNYILGMLYARALIANKEYAKADSFLGKLTVLPNEGATSGRQLYRETKLMLAIGNMDKGNCKKALRYISQSKLWPERLGSGKPYQEDIDERVEEWLSYQCLMKTTHRKDAQEALNKILI